jgi:sigma-B regulation protein RsbU (phosphoserine phosphatase)
VRGIVGKAAQRRLDAEANVLAEVLRAEVRAERATSELHATQEQLQAITELARAMRRHLSLGEVLEDLVRELRRLTAAELAFAVVPELGQDLFVSVPAAPGEWGDTVRRVATATRSSGSLLVFEHGSEGSAELEIPAYVEDLIAVPVEIAGRPGAVLGLANQRDAQRSVGTRNLLQSVAGLAGAFMESAALHDRMLARGLSERESELAADIQSALMPHVPPAVPGIDLVARFRSAADVGGDFYDYVVRPNGQLALFLGDVSGKGWPAAMVMTMTLAVLRAASQLLERPSAVLERANAELYAELNEVGGFVTAFAGNYDAATARLAFASAGHSPVLYRARGGRTRLLRATGLPLGVLRERPPTAAVVRLGPGDLLVVATDGLSEATSPTGELFGHQRLLRLVDANAMLDARVIADRLFTAVTEFAAGRSQDDDQTLVVAKGR